MNMCGGSSFKIGKFDIDICLGYYGGEFRYDSPDGKYSLFAFGAGNDDSEKLISFLSEFSKEDIIKGIVDMLQNGEEY